VDLYEYQGKELFRLFGIPTSEGRLAATPAEARTAAEELGGQVVVKAQVLTGGRGKAGGVKLADDPADAEHKAEEILGLDINGHVVRKLWIEQASEIAKEYYLSVTFDRGTKQSLFMLTTEGGVEIEEVAEKAVAVHAHDRGRRRDRGGRREEPRCARAAARRPVRGLPAVPGAAPDLRRRD
jgi:succinyl-CoA synthetase beta subunit